MFDLGWFEFLLVLGLAILVIGPDDLPGIMKTIGGFVKRMRYMRYAFSEQFEAYIEQADNFQGTSQGISQGISQGNSQKAETHKSERKEGIMSEALQDQAMNEGENKNPSDTTKEIYQKITHPYMQNFSNVSAHLEDLVQKIPAESDVLDLGCGHGVDCLHLASLGHCVTGVDIAPAMIEQAQEASQSQNACKNLQFIKSDMIAFDIEQAGYDAILSLYSLIHLEKKDVTEMLLKIHAGLKAGGHVFLGLYLGESEELWEPEPFDPSMDVFLNIYSEGELEEVLKTAGFKIEERYYLLPGRHEFDYKKCNLILKK